MRTFRVLASASLLVVSSVAIAADPVLKQDAQAVDQACAADAAAAQCGSERVGTGLLRCLKAYRKSNPGFKLSAGCAAATRQLRGDHKERRNPPPAPPAG
ncbi:MAG: hypothetical protein P4L83_06095 [Nevskia sp.]|nr:hypothetical protein [Nevskia sp.]